jgi:aconitate hydratase
LPYSLKILLENMLRHENGGTVTADDARAVAAWLKEKRSNREIAFSPARVLMQDYTGVPAIVDLAAMRDAVAAEGGDPNGINPLCPVDLVIDHSLTVNNYGTPQAFQANVDIEFEQNKERYLFLSWGQKSFNNFRVVPPGTGICHQVNLENLAQVVATEKTSSGTLLAFPDTVVGTDSHTTMVNGLAVLGWGVGGIEAEAAMLGQPISMLIPQVIGMRLTGALRQGVTATDMVLHIVKILRKKGVVDKFVEFYGPALDELSLQDRATIANMAPEYGATCGFFPIDAETIRYMHATARPAEQIALTEAYAKAQGLWRDANAPEPVFSDTVELDISTIRPCVAGPKRPQDLVNLEDAAASFAGALKEMASVDAPRAASCGTFDLHDGDVVIAAITSCTNTSNPSVMIGAGLLAKNAVEKGLKVKPWVKTSLAPGSQTVADYLQAAGLQQHLDTLGFNIVGFGCTTCIGNSGALVEPVAKAIDKEKIVVAAVLSSNRNFEGRVHPQVKTNYLASPPLVVAYALFGSVARDIVKDQIGTGKDGKPVYLKDIWPSTTDIKTAMDAALKPELFAKRYADVFKGPEVWRNINVASGTTYKWEKNSTYIRLPPYFDGKAVQSGNIMGARALAIFGDSVTTDHISPAGSIKADSPAGRYLIAQGVKAADFNSYGARRGNHEVMMRGTFGNGRIRNLMVPGTEGGITKHQPSGEQMPIYDAAMKYAAEKTPLIVIAGKEYGTGSSRDWAAKGPRLLNVRAAVVESFERIHRSNLIGMGVLPLQFKEGVTRETLKLDGTETFELTGLANGIKPRMDVTLTIIRQDGSREQTVLICRIDTLDEAGYFQSGGILQYVLGNLNMKAAA